MGIAIVVIGINEGITVATGYNFGVSLLGEKVYSSVSSAIGFGGYMYMYGGAMLPYPSTGKGPSNLKEQLVMGEAIDNSTSGKVIISNLGDSRFPGWLGWQKYSYKKYEIEVHYIGNKFFPRWYPFSPWFDYKIK